jgi:hypothetical protein
MGVYFRASICPYRSFNWLCVFRIHLILLRNGEAGEEGEEVREEESSVCAQETAEIQVCVQKESF